MIILYTGLSLLYRLPLWLVGLPQRFPVLAPAPDLRRGNPLPRGGWRDGLWSVLLFYINYINIKHEYKFKEIINIFIISPPGQPNAPRETTRWTVVRIIIIYYLWDFYFRTARGPFLINDLQIFLQISLKKSRFDFMSLNGDFMILNDGLYFEKDG